MKKLLTILALTILFSSCEKLENDTNYQVLDQYIYLVYSNECTIAYNQGGFVILDLSLYTGDIPFTVKFEEDEFFTPALRVMSKTTTDSITVEIVKNKEIIYTNKY